ncbi:MAG: cytochrome C biogenesis protein, partial [Candidatus Afipia apatlaquensis]|nr:cytochrome C biogenesis protein [Candidatus Afipia apatlaquensis]
AAPAPVAQPAKVGDAPPIAIRGVRRGGKLVLVDVALDEKNATHKDKEVQLFAEGPTPDWALPVPKLIQREADGVLRFAFELEGLPPGATADGAILKLTVAGPGGAYEVNAAVPPKTD